MELKELIKSGELTQARSKLITAVKSSPADQGTRFLLFQVLVCMGEWDKARRHLEIIAAQDPGRQAGVQVYLDLIQAETERIEIAHTKRQPSFLPESPAYLKIYENACQNLHKGRFQAAKADFLEISNRRPSVSGTLNNKQFSEFQGTDTRLSCFLEAFVHERYLLLPFEFIRELILLPPKNFLDLLWVSAQITTWEGLTLNCFLPVLYTETFLRPDDRLRRGQMTDWIDLGEKIFQGVGQHVFQLDEEDIGILEIQQIIFNPVAVE
jgi:type VI secretion system protein ImpE